MYNRRFYILLAFIMMLSFLTGCGGNSGGSENAAISANTTDGGSIPAESAPGSDGTTAANGSQGSAATALTLSWDAPVDVSGNHRQD